jgi:hypothetical protein
MRLCEGCQEPLLPQRRRSARFCSPACRVASFRRRTSVTHAQTSKPTARVLRRSAGTSTVAHAAKRPAAVLRERVTLSRVRAADIEPDKRWPGMWRVRFADGSLSDMVNRTRAHDVLRALRGTQ